MDSDLQEQNSDIYKEAIENFSVVSFLAFAFLRISSPGFGVCKITKKVKSCTRLQIVEFNFSEKNKDFHRDLLENFQLQLLLYSLFCL